MDLRLLPAFRRPPCRGGAKALDFGGSDLLQADAGCWLRQAQVCEFPGLQLQTELLQLLLQLPVTSVHLDVVVLQLLLVSDFNTIYGRYLRLCLSFLRLA